MKNLFISLSCLLILCSATTMEPVVWSGEKLSWEHFRKRAGNEQFYKAFTYSGIRFSTGEREGKAYIEVEAFFDPDESWVHPESMTTRLLNHEQRHFDICEVYARKMRKIVADYLEMPIETFMSDGHSQIVKNAYMNLNNELFRQQQLYDVDTRHGSDAEAQHKWDEWIDARLAE